MLGVVEERGGSCKGIVVQTRTDAYMYNIVDGRYSETRVLSKKVKLDDRHGKVPRRVTAKLLQ